MSENTNLCQRTWIFDGEPLSLRISVGGTRSASEENNQHQKHQKKSEEDAWWRVEQDIVKTWLWEEKTREKEAFVLQFWVEKVCTFQLLEDVCELIKKIIH